MLASRTILCAAALLALADTASARMMNDRQRSRAEAEHACYNDASTLCPDAIPDEAKIEACMKANRAKLSPACRKIFDRGID